MFLFVLNTLKYLVQKRIKRNKKNKTYGKI